MMPAMGFFDRIFGRKSRTARRWAADAGVGADNPGLLVLLNAPPVLDAAAVGRALNRIEPCRGDPKFTSRLAQDDQPDDRHVVYGTFEFDGHTVDVIGLDVPVPQPILDKTVAASHWTGAGREAMEKHTAHYVLIHQGGGPSTLERMIALYKLAAALGGPSLAGVLHEAAWSCAPAAVVREFENPEFLRACRDQVPPILFTGFLKFLADDGTWFATKGHHVFGAPDFVMQGTAADKPSDVLDLFMNIFLYVISADRELQAGHTMQIAEEIFLRFGEVPAGNIHRAALMGAGRTLLITRIGKHDING